MTEIEVKQGLKTKNGQEAPAPELSQKIIEQVEYYFGDINLPRDKFLQDEIKKGDGWVALETMLKFNRLKQLTKDTYQISNALQDSLLIQVSGDMKKIRRSPEILLPEDWLEYCREIKTRTVYVKGFPVDTKLDEILGFVKPHGTVEKIVMRHVKGRPTFRGSVFVTFADKEAAQRFLNNDRVKEYNGQELLKLMQTDYWARKKLETISKKMEKKQTLPKSKTKNDRLKSRPDLQDYKENLFFTSKTISDVYVSPSVFAKWPIRSVVNKNLQELKKIINDKRFPIDGLNYGFSHYDQRRPEMLALLSGDKKLYDEYMKLNKALNSERDERLQRPTTEECLLRKMATGRTNYQQLDPATAKIERTRGGREGNNALINYDCRYNNMAPDKSVQLILESNPSFDMLDHAANHKDSSVIRRHELAGQIHYAVRCGHRKLAGSMIKAYAEHEFDQLHIKSLLNDKEGLGKFVPMDASKKSANHKNITPIHMAAINPSAKFLNTLIPLQSNFNDPDTDNWHTIHYAAVCEGPSPLKHLLDLNTPIILQTNRNETPLHCAARTGRVENLKLLVAALRKLKDADTNKDTTNYDDEDGEPKSKRSKYSKYQKTDIVTVQLNAKDLAGFTPLHMAVENGHIDVVKFLLSQPEINVEVQTGAAKNKKLGRGQRCLGGNNAGTKKITPLILACQKGNIEMVEVLINEGKAYIDQPDRFKRTPLSHAIIGGHFHIVNLLLKLGASLSKKPDSSGNSAAHYAAAYGWLDILNLLVQIEPDILNQPNDWHLTPLPIAYLKGHLGIVEHVLNGEYAEKIDINAVDNDGCTLLMLIIKNRDIIGPSKSIKDQVEYLISKGADASKVDSFSNSTLHYFASLNVKLKATHPDDFNPQNKTHTFENKLRLTFKEYEQTIDYLLNAGAKLDVKNDKNSIPVDLALRTGNLILTRYLFEKDPKLSLDFWKSIELECENRRTNVLHLLVDLPFKVHAEVNVWSGVYGPMEEQYDVIPILKNIIDKVDQKTLIDWLKEYNTQGHTPLHKLCQNICGLTRVGPTIGENADKVKRKNDTFVFKSLELLEILIDIYPEAILARIKPSVGEGLDNQNANSYLNFGSLSSRSSSFSSSSGASFSQVEKKPFLLNIFEISLNCHALDEQDQYFTYVINGKSYVNKNMLLVKLIDVAKRNGLLRDVLTQRDHMDRTPLLYCIDTNNIDSANLIIYESNEAKISHFIHNAVIRKKLLEGEVSKGQPKEIELRKSALHIALSQSLFDIAENLNLTPIDLAFTDAEGANAMHYLSRLHSDKISKIFEQYKDAGVSLVADIYGRYPLHYAVNCLLGQDSADIITKTIEWLLKYEKVGVNAQDKKGRTALHYAFIPIDKDEQKAQDIVQYKKIDPIAVVTLLVKEMSPESLKAVDDRGNTALHYAALCGANICVATLLRYNIDVNSKNIIGNTPLGLAVIEKREDVTLTLIQAKADIGGKVYGEKPNLTELARNNRWVWLPKREPTPASFESTIISLVVQNGWQGIIYMIIDLLDKSTETILYLTSAAIEHKKYNLMQTSLRMLEKVKTGSITDTKLFTLLAKNLDGLNDTQKNVIKVLFEAGIPWAEKDGTSKCIEILSKSGRFHVMTEIETLDYKFYKGKNWENMKSSSTALVILQNLIEYWSDDLSDKQKQDLKIWLSKVSGWCKGTLETLPIEFEKPAFDGMQTPMPTQSAPEKQRITALIRAVQKKNVELAKYLICEMKVNINAKDENGRTPLMHALMENAETIVYILFDPEYKFSKKGEVQQMNINDIQEEFGDSNDDDEESLSEEETIDEKMDTDEATLSNSHKKRKMHEIVEEMDTDETTLSNSLNKKRKTHENEEDDDGDSDAAPLQANETPRFQFGIYSEVRSNKIPRREVDTTTELLSASGKKIPKQKTGLDLTIKDNSKANILHYIVSPNGWENVTLLQQFFKVEPNIKQLLNEINDKKETPSESAKNMKQFEIFKEMSFNSNEKIGEGLKWDAGVAPEPCSYDVDTDSKKFLEIQAKKIMEKTKKRQKANKPNKHSGYAETGEIVMDGTGKLYKVLMHKTEILNGSSGFHNFYRMELIHRRGSNLYILFTNWGRIGEYSGQFQSTPFGSLSEAEKQFNSIFLKSTENKWENIDNFVEKPNKYRIITLTENSIENMAELEINLKFHEEEKGKYKEDMTEEETLYCFIKDISNVKRMQEKARMLCSYSRVSAPFGKFSRDDLIKAKKILSDLLICVRDLEKLRCSSNEGLTERLLAVYKRQAELTNDFYRHIPLGGFENTSLPMLDQKLIIKEFDKMVEQMLEFEIAGKIVTAAAQKQETIDPFKYISDAIETSITLLNPDSLDAQHILQYIQNSSAVKVSAIFSVASKNSVELFKESGVKLHNHRYLWHGTKPENLLSILKLGLLATPPHAIPCGQAFGEGIYFADTFQKSQAYCTQSVDGYKYMLLCEVALGDVYTDYNFNIYDLGEDLEKKVKQYNTLKILGSNRPNPIYNKTLSTGVVMPLGSLIQSYSIYEDKREIYAYSDYNEYIVKDQRNTVVRYLVRFQ